MSERYMPHPDELIDHEAEHLNLSIRHSEERLTAMSWPTDTGYDYLLDPDSWDDRPNPLLGEG